MIVDHPFLYEAVVRLPRNRHSKSVLVEEMIPVPVRDVPENDAPVALRAPARRRGDPRRVDHRFFEGSFYVPLDGEATDEDAETVGNAVSSRLWSAGDDIPLDTYEMDEIRSVEWSTRSLLLPAFLEGCSGSFLSVDGVLHRRMDPPVVLKAHSYSTLIANLPACAWQSDSAGLHRMAYTDVPAKDEVPVVEVLRPDLLAFDPDPIIASELARIALDIPETTTMGRDIDRGGAFAPAARLENALMSGADVDEILSLVDAVWEWRLKLETNNQIGHHVDNLRALRRRRHRPDPRSLLPLPGEPDAASTRSRFSVRVGGYSDVHVLEADVPKVVGTTDVVARVTPSDGRAVLVLHDGVSFLVPFEASEALDGDALPALEGSETAGNRIVRWKADPADGSWAKRPPGLDVVVDAARLGISAGLAVVDGVVHVRVHEPILRISDEGCVLVLDPLFDGSGTPKGRSKNVSGEATLSLIDWDLVGPVADAFDVVLGDAVPPQVDVHDDRLLGSSATVATGSRLLRKALAGYRIHAFSQVTRTALHVFADAGPLRSPAVLAAALEALADDPAAGLVRRSSVFEFLSIEISPRLARRSGADVVPDEESDAVLGLGF